MKELTLAHNVPLYRRHVGTRRLYPAQRILLRGAEILLYDPETLVLGDESKRVVRISAENLCGDTFYALAKDVGL